MTFTRDAVAEALHKIVAEKGEDYTYPGTQQRYGTNCTYSDQEGNPSCIVGFVVAALEPDTFREIAEAELDKGESTGIEEIAVGWEYEFDGEGEPILVTPPLTDDNLLIEALAMAQGAQDGGLTWGQATEYFDRVMAGEDMLIVRTQRGVAIKALKAQFA